jgi:NTP pyrophosphatase (non-canonical NTP hydrolase)
MLKSKLNLKKNPALKDFQEYVAKMITERGFDNETLPEVFMLFLEECGEFARSARKKTQTHIKAYKGKKHDGSVDHEAADVFLYLLNLCNRLDIDLEKAFRNKERINKKRIWK